MISGDVRRRGVLGGTSLRQASKPVRDKQGCFVQLLSSYSARSTLGAGEWSWNGTRTPLRTARLARDLSAQRRNLHSQRAAGQSCKQPDPQQHLAKMTGKLRKVVSKGFNLTGVRVDRAGG